MIGWLFCFLVTLGVELAVVLALARRRVLHPMRLAPFVLLANLVTHPLAFWALASAPSFEGRVLILLASELVLIPVVEGLVYRASRKLTLTEALGVSYVANGVSCAVGLLVALFA